MMVVGPKKAYFEWKTQEFSRERLDKDKLSRLKSILSVAHYFKETLLIVF